MIRKALFLLQLFPLYQWMRGVRELRNKVRLSPSAVLLGRGRSFSFGYGAKIGPRSRLRTLEGGRIRLGEKVWVSSDVEMETSLQVLIGSGTTIQRRCTINGATRIGANCILAPNVFISSGTHPFREIPHLPIRKQEQRLSGDANTVLDKAVWVQDDCWLGANVVVCPGVTIGKGSVIGANTVVTRDVAPYTIIAGNPGRPIGKRLDWKPLHALSTDREDHLIYILSDSVLQCSATACTNAIVSVGRPLCFALAVEALEKGIRLYYEATVNEMVHVAEAEYRIVAGKNVLDLPGTALVSKGDYTICEIILVKSRTSRPVFVSRIEIRE